MIVDVNNRIHPEIPLHLFDIEISELGNCI